MYVYMFVPSRDVAQLLHELVSEIGLQDAKHGPFSNPNRLGRSRLAIACLEDEVQEVKDAWRAERKEPSWTCTTTEIMQVAAIAIRAIRDMQL